MKNFCFIVTLQQSYHQNIEIKNYNVIKKFLKFKLLKKLSV